MPDITITLTDEQIEKIGAELGTGNIDEIRAWLLTHLNGVLRNYEIHQSTVDTLE